jgi:hypothetical protein
LSNINALTLLIPLQNKLRSQSENMISVTRLCGESLNMATLLKEKEGGREVVMAAAN